MALGATVYVLNIDLADSDRGVYLPLELRVARHPSEGEEYLLTRMLAYCFEYTEGIAFSNGLFAPDDPTLAVRDLTGMMRVRRRRDCIAPQRRRNVLSCTPTRNPAPGWRGLPGSEFIAPNRSNCMPWIGTGWRV
jgi:uncharacterized protein YaeQ